MCILCNIIGPSYPTRSAVELPADGSKESQDCLMRPHMQTKQTVEPALTVSLGVDTTIARVLYNIILLIVRLPLISIDGYITQSYIPCTTLSVVALVAEAELSPLLAVRKYHDSPVSSSSMLHISKMDSVKLRLLSVVTACSQTVCYIQCMHNNIMGAVWKIQLQLPIMSSTPECYPREMVVPSNKYACLNTLALQRANSLPKP